MSLFSCFIQPRDVGRVSWVEKVVYFLTKTNLTNFRQRCGVVSNDWLSKHQKHQSIEYIHYSLLSLTNDWPSNFDLRYSYTFIIKVCGWVWHLNAFSFGLPQGYQHNDVCLSLFLPLPKYQRRMSTPEN